MADDDTPAPQSQAQKPSRFPDLKIDFPALLAVNIFVTFAVVIIASAVFKVPIDDGLKQTLVSIVMLMVGFYFGSSAGSKAKDDARLKQEPKP